MPMIKSASKEAFNENVTTLIHEGHEPDKAMFIALRIQREAKHKKPGAKKKS